LSISIRELAELENMMTSSQRVYNYTKLETEDALELPYDEELKQKEWP